MDFIYEYVKGVDPRAMLCSSTFDNNHFGFLVENFKFCDFVDLDYFCLNII